MNLTHLKQNRAAAKDAMDALMAKATTENRALTAEEGAAFDKHEADFNSLHATIERAERSAKLPALTGAPVSPAGARRPATVHNNAEDAPFANLGEMLLCVRSAAVQPSAIDPRLQNRAALGANEKVGSEGGFLVGTDMGNLENEMHDEAVLAPLCSEVPISTDANGTILNGVDETSRADGSRFGGVQGYWADEAQSVTATKPKFRQIELRLKKLFATFYATDEVLADAATLTTEAQRAYREEMAFKLDDALVRGTGSGQPLGILNAPVLVSVAKETGQAAASVLYENIVKMYARMPARSKRNAAWFINDDVMPQLQLMTIAAGASNVPVYLPPGGASAAPFGTIFGRPVIPIEQCETLGTVGDIIFGDYSQYKLATKGGIQEASSIHVQFLTDQQVFRFTYRVDGQPARSTPLTPFKGSATKSPFVVLATRA
jgi:HK97 family phage major capsid protein